MKFGLLFKGEGLVNKLKRYGSDKVKDVHEDPSFLEKSNL